MYDQFCFFCAFISSEISVGYRRSHIPIGLVQRVFGIFQRNGLRDQLNVLVRMYCVQPLIIYSVQCIREGFVVRNQLEDTSEVYAQKFPCFPVVKG